MTDERRVHRIFVDVLATEAQVQALQEVIGTALCAAPPEHDGPCRIAWSLSHTSALSAEHVADVREHLAPVEVWPPEAVNQSLGLTGND